MKKLTILIGVFFVSFSAILVRYSTVSTWVLVFWRMALAFLLLCPVVFWKHRAEFFQMSGRDRLKSCISGLFLGLHLAAYFESLHFTSIGASVVLADTEVFFVALISLALWREKIPLWGWVGIGLTFLGAVTVACSQIQSGGQLYGNLLALSSAAFMSVYTLLGRSVRKRHSTTVYTLWVYGCAAVTMAICALWNGETLAVDGTNFAIGLGLALFCTLLGHSIFSWGLRYEKAAFVSMSKLLEPIFAALLGLALFRETLPVTTILGGFTILLGIFVYTRKESL